MDSSIRDLDLIEEHDPGEGSGRRIAILAIAGIVTISAVLLMGTLVDQQGDLAQQDELDPLAALTETEGLAPAETMDIEVPDVDREALLFPETLAETAASDEQRPEVLAAMAAAAAEHDFLGNDASSMGALSLDAEQRALAARIERQAEIEDAVARVLPAGSTAQHTHEVLARSMGQDRLVAESVEHSAEQVGAAARPRPRAAAPGHEGPYTLQVISYRTREEADSFATTLRGKGHAAFVTVGDVPERGIHYRVRIGPFEREVDANRYRSQFERDEQMNTFVVRRRD